MVNKQPHLFCFGLGYTGTVLAGSLRDLGWQVSGTTREPSDGSDAYPFSGHAEEVEAIAATLRTATHVLSTIPTMELGDPILAAVEQVLAECEDLTWIGYLSTTGVYGDTGGDWVSEDTPINPSTQRGQRRKAAEQAWKKAFTAYLNCRKDGGYGQTNSAQIVEMFRRGTKQENSSELETMFEQVSNMDLTENKKLLFSKLKLVLDGNRDISLAMDYGLNYQDAVELHLLLEWLVEKGL